MSSQILDTSTMKPEYPWKKYKPTVVIANSLIVAIPMSVYAFFFFFTDLPGALIFIAIFLPIQIAMAIIMTIFSLGKRRVG
ncbi:MAG: hypothetical protein ACKOMW_00710, partial [Actinomycetes bacterium]